MTHPKRIGLSKFVFLVCGARGAAIYDLRCRRLFSMDADAGAFLIGLLGPSGTDTRPNSEQRRFMRQLRRLGLLTWTDSTASHHIVDLKQPLKLSMAWIEVCKDCNLHCVHCYNSGSSHKPTTASRMTIDDFASAIDQVEKAGIDTIQLIGGEPLVLGETLKEMVRCCSGRFRRILLFTNGTLMTPDWAEFFRAHDVNLVTSVFSYSADDHDRVTQVAGSYRRTHAGFQMLSDAQTGFKVSCVHGFEGVSLGNKNTDLYSLETEGSTLRMTGRASLDLLGEPGVRQKLITKQTFSRPLDPARVARQVSGHNCFASKIYIDTELQVYPCVMERRLKHGDLRKGRLPTVLRNDLRELTKDRISGCSQCEFRYACFDCRPDSNGNPEFSKPWNCTYDPKQGCWEDPAEFISRVTSTRQQIRQRGERAST